MSAPALLAALRRSLFGPRTLRSQGINIENVKPVYDCGSLPWWTRWTYFIVAVDVITLASACELSWNHWTKWEELPPEAFGSTTPSSGSSTSTPQPKDPSQVLGHYVLRPWWQRGVLSLFTFATGTGIAAILLGSRSRIVRRMFILPSSSSASASKPSAANRQVVIQSAGHSNSQGVVIPLQRTRLVQSPEGEMMIGLKDGRGRYTLALDRAEINGKKLSLWDARRELFTEWYGERKGQQLFLTGSGVKGA